MREQLQRLAFVPALIGVAISACFSDPGREQTSTDPTATAATTATDATTIGPGSESSDSSGPDPTTTTTGTTDPTGTASDTETECTELDCDSDGIANDEELIAGADCRISDPNEPDTDKDGLQDNEDPYPRDPFPPFILVRNNLGTIDLMVSNQDGTFADPIEIGNPYGGTMFQTYRYPAMVISDFNNDGKLDFLAIGDHDLTLEDPRHLWWFERTGINSFSQQLIDDSYELTLPGTVADLNRDGFPDLIHLDRVQPNNISEGWLYTYLNSGLIGSASCGASELPDNPGKCAFVKQLGVDLTPWVENQWTLAFTRYPTDRNRDGFPDLALARSSNEGNTVSPVIVLLGTGDGTFAPPGATVITHNAELDATPARTLGTVDYNQDGYDDIFIGLDEDGDDGSLWLYPGMSDSENGTAWTSDTAVEILDLGDHGSTSAVAVDDFNLDGKLDFLIGYNPILDTGSPTQIEFFPGSGSSELGNSTVIRTFDSSDLGYRFAAPIRGCVPAATP